MILAGAAAGGRVGATSRVGRDSRPCLLFTPSEVEGYNTDMAATVIALQGELGSGKTTFAQAFGKVVGVEDHMQSPTFVIMKSYDVDWKGYKKLIHIDAYRLESESELLHLGWDEMIKDAGNLILIEWPERVEGIIPKDSKRIHFKHDRP